MRESTIHFPPPPPQAQALSAMGHGTGYTLLVGRCSQHTSALSKTSLSAFWELPKPHCLFFGSSLSGPRALASP